MHQIWVVISKQTNKYIDIYTYIHICISSSLRCHVKKYLFNITFNSCYVISQHQKPGWENNICEMSVIYYINIILKMYNSSFPFLNNYCLLFYASVLVWEDESKLLMDVCLCQLTSHHQRTGCWSPPRLCRRTRKLLSCSTDLQHTNQNINTLNPHFH